VDPKTGKGQYKNSKGEWVNGKKPKKQKTGKEALGSTTPSTLRIPYEDGIDDGPRISEDGLGTGPMLYRSL
jgi:hypothetical protein